MTLDEQIAWLEEEACQELRDAQPRNLAFATEEECREQAAMLLTIENTLRAVRDAAR